MPVPSDNLNPITERPNYYAGQYLLEDDFELEQQYHIDRLRRHHRLLHVAGIVYGLEVSWADSPANTKLHLTAGTAIDKDGRQIILSQDKSDISPPTISSNGSILFIRYESKEFSTQGTTAPQPQGGDSTTSPPGATTTLTPTDGNNRIKEEPVLEWGETIPAAAIALARITTDKELKLSDRVYSGIRLPSPLNTLGQGLTLRYKGNGKSPGGQLELAEFTGNLSITGNTTVTGTLNVMGDSIMTGNVGIGTVTPYQQLTIMDGIGFANHNARDKKLYSPTDGVLEWKTHTDAPGHAFVVSHQGSDPKVCLDIKGNSYFMGGNVGIGTTSPTEKLEVNGKIKAIDAILTGSLSVTGISFFSKSLAIGATDSQYPSSTKVGTGTISSSGTTVTGNGTRFQTELQVGDLITATYTPTGSTQVTRTRKVTAISSDISLTTDIAFDPSISSQTSFKFLPMEIFFSESGQIRSLDDNHRILFRRRENILELREHGDIIFSAGAKSGQETAKVVIKDSGNVGIGIKNPQGNLDVRGEAINGKGTISSSGTTVSGNDTQFLADGQLKVGDCIIVTYSVNSISSTETRRVVRIQGNNQLSVDSSFSNDIPQGTHFTFKPQTLLVQNDKVVIGRDPEASHLLVVGGNMKVWGPVEITSSGPPKSIGSYMFLRNTQPTIGNMDSAVGKVDSSAQNYSLTAAECIAAKEFHARSDVRIKEIQGPSESKTDLQLLRQLVVTDYFLKDEVPSSRKPRKKVIGQQVAQVFPQAVNTDTAVVPDVFKPASMADGWVELADHDLKTGENVKILTENYESKICKVESVQLDKFKVSLDYTGKVFIYGREVHDFHVVDYDALSSLNISATQELYKIIQALQAEVQQLKAQLHPDESTRSPFSIASP